MKTRTSISMLCFGLWLLVSLASLAAMYQLWWSRERVLYIRQNRGLTANGRV